MVIAVWYIKLSGFLGAHENEILDLSSQILYGVRGNSSLQ